MRVAVIGGGVYGSTTAVAFARDGHEVDLFERHDDLLFGATRATQGRLHHGYHYPRAPDSRLLQHAHQFADRFRAAIVTNAAHYYCIASRDSQVTGAQYLSFCQEQRLPYRTSIPALVRETEIQLSVEVPEAVIDIEVLRATLSADLRTSGVTTHFAAPTHPADLDGYEWVVNATYGRYGRRPLQFEVCETVVVKLPKAFAAKSFVVLDGPFISLDPLPGQDYHLLYDVTSSVHSTNVGYAPIIPANLAQLVDQGIIFTPLSRVDAMLDNAARFLRGVDRAEYVGSYFTVRAILPDVEASDERPALIECAEKNITVLSGKIDMAVWAARRALDLAQDTASATSA